MLRGLLTVGEEWTETAVHVLRSEAGVELEGLPSLKDKSAVYLLGTVLVDLPGLPGGC